MTSQENSLNWFEISVKDLARAKKFYEKVFGIKMTEMDMMGMKMAFSPGKAEAAKQTEPWYKAKCINPAKLEPKSI